MALQNDVLHAVFRGDIPKSVQLHIPGAQLHAVDLQDRRHGGACLTAAPVVNMPELHTAAELFHPELCVRAAVREPVAVKLKVDTGGIGIRDQNVIGAKAGLYRQQLHIVIVVKQVDPFVTFDRRLRKDAFYLCKAAWNKTEPFVHLCGKRYTNRCEDRTEIKAYSNQPEVKLYVDGALFAAQTGKTVFRFELPLLGEHLIRAEADGCGDSMVIRRVSEPDESYIFNKAAASVTNWFDADEIDPGCFSINDTLGEIRAHPQAGAIVDAMMAKGASERGDVADAVKDNPALQRMMGRMTMLSLLKQSGADEEAVRRLNRVLQGIKK